jgi:lysophospholipase L1-like esterase
MNAMVSVCRKLAVMAIASFVILLIAELVARAAEPGEFRWYDMSPYEKVANLPHVHRRRARVQWDGSYYEINTRGWRGPEFQPSYASDELRVVAIGDSCTFGKAVEEADSWPRQLERELQSRLGAARRVQVANLGVNGYSSRDYLEVLKTQAIEVKPHVVVVGYCLNDFPNALKQVDAAVFQGKESLRAQLSWDMREQLGRLALFRWLRASYYEFRRSEDLAQVELLASRVVGDAANATAGMDAERQRAEEMRAICIGAGAELVTMLFPYESQVYLDTAVAGPGPKLKTTMESIDVPFLDLASVFRESLSTNGESQRLFVRGDRYHPNAEGYALVARSVAAQILARVAADEGR